MDTLRRIWQADIKNIDNYIISQGVDPDTLSDIDRYIFVSIRQMEEGILQKFESKLVNVHDFSSIMRKTEKYPHDQRLTRGITEIINKYFRDGERIIENPNREPMDRIVPQKIDFFSTLDSLSDTELTELVNPIVPQKIDFFSTLDSLSDTELTELINRINRITPSKYRFK